jgi:pimeloyl-ACP methyl ester carboxylesterase
LRTVRSSDGVDIAVHDLGGDGAPLLMVHATGFHGHVFEPMARPLAGMFHCWALDVRGHGDTATPAGLDFEWRGFADDVLAACEVAGDGPVYGFGHSSGGAALLMAEARRPGTFAGLFCYEPVVWPDLAAIKERAEGLAEGARRRRQGFASRQAAYDNYASKPPFAWMDPAALKAYVEHAFRDCEDGTVALKCRPDDEAAIYLKGAENDAFPLLAHVASPVVIVRGTQRMAIESEIVDAQLAALPQGREFTMDGLGHFGPLEQPAVVAEAVRAGLA